jgi:hypothetical protein
MGLFVTDATFAWDGKVRWRFVSLWRHADGFVAGREAFEISSELHRHTAGHQSCWNSR